MQPLFNLAGLVLFVAFLVGLHEFYFHQEVNVSDACCKFPCMNQGVCVTSHTGNFTCDCTGTGYYGEHCDTPEFATKVSNMFKPKMQTLQNWLTSDNWVLKLINKYQFLREYFTARLILYMSDLYDSPPLFDNNHSYKTVDIYFNLSLSARALPQVPKHCPKSMGSVGLTKLPEIGLLIKNVFDRKEFVVDQHDSNLLFLFYGLHFGEQFTHSINSPKLVLGGQLDASHIYGVAQDGHTTFRSHADGKLLSVMFDGEEYPSSWLNLVKKLKNGDLALPRKNPGHFVLSTIWLREHNRVCDELLKLFPDWEDERLYQTARNIIIGEMVKITFEEFLQHLTQYKLKLSLNPFKIHKTFQFHDRTHTEIQHLFDWTHFTPNTLLVYKSKYSLNEMSNILKPIIKEGFDKFVHALVDTPAGAITNGNHGKSSHRSLRQMLSMSRQLRFQGFNAYRRRVNLKPYTSFEELTGEKEMASQLQKLYQDIDTVEFYVGLFAEKTGPAVVSETMATTLTMWTTKSLVSNPINSPGIWRPSTFGGDFGWNLVHNANLEDLFCKNMRTACRDIAFEIPWHLKIHKNSSNNKNSTNE